MYDAIELLQAHAKQSRAELHTYTGTDCITDTALTQKELQGLLIMAIIESQCSSLVSNLYYTSHYVFSIHDNHPLRESAVTVKTALQKIMQLDITKAIKSPSSKTSMRKELSLHDLMQVTSEVEQRFDRPRSSGGLLLLYYIYIYIYYELYI